MKIIQSKLFPFLVLGGILTFFSACNSDNIEDLPAPETREIWTGTPITFEKLAGTDDAEASNQDRITDEVWITRSKDGSEIYNAKSENEPDKGSSPKGTQWALGTIADIDNLSFKSFRDAVGKPKNVVGKDLVLFLTQEEIFISVKFTAWTQGKGGGFAYERSTK
ncbi:MAG: hypothetical protein AB8G86_15950 [Saprospiraceae bacterium]